MGPDCACIDKIAASHACPEPGIPDRALFSSEMAVDIYRKIGYQEYGVGNIYMWQPEEDSQ